MNRVRRARREEAAALADLWLQSRAAAPIPAPAHSEREVREWIGQVLLPSHEVWVSTVSATPVAMLALDRGWVEQLYVSPSHQRQGHGTRLLELAQTREDALALWTFESNVPGQLFYESRGFIRSGSGSDDNEEGAPAILYRWKR